MGKLGQSQRIENLHAVWRDEVKNFTVDYTTDSLAHIAGKITGITPYPNTSFTAQVDTKCVPEDDVDYSVI